MFDIALTAQNSKIWDLVTLVQKFHHGIAKFSLVTTLDSGLVIKSVTGIDVHLLSCGFEGGYLQLARLVNIGNLRLVIFLHDPLLSLDHPGILEFLKSCNVQNIPFANNVTTSEFILDKFLEKEMAIYWRCPEVRSERNSIYV